jgi:hypothetical protein
MRADCDQLAYDDVVSRSPPIQYRQQSPRPKADRSLAIVLTVPTPASARRCGSRRRSANPHQARATPNYGSFQLTLLDTTPRSALLSALIGLRELKYSPLPVMPENLPVPPTTS